MVDAFIIPALGTLRQEACCKEASLGEMVSQVEGVRE